MEKKVGLAILRQVIVMAHNRKSQPASIRFGPALKAFLLCLLIGGSGVGYVAERTIVATGPNRLKAGNRWRLGGADTREAKDSN